MMKPKVGSYAVYEPAEEGWQDFEAQFKQVNEALEQAGLEVVPAPQPVKDLASCEAVAAWFAGKDIDLLHALIVTWSFDHYTIEIQQKVRRPVAIRSIPGIRSGSLVAGQQLNSILADIEVERRLFFGPLESQETIQETATYARACAIQKRLAGSRMAVIGRRTEGMTPTAVDEVEILRLFGVRLLNFGMDELYAMMEHIPLPEARTEWRRITMGAQAVTSDKSDGFAAARAYLALKQLVAALNLQAVSIGSYPQCQGTMCVPIALLNEDGIPTGCEGDVNSTLAMAILSMLSDSPVHFGEMLDVDERENTIVSSHCGCGSPSLAGEGGYTFCPVRLANSGVCIRYAARPGPVTFVNLVGRKGNYRLCAFEGQAIPTEMVFEGTPMKFRMTSPFRKIWKKTADDGFGHHWMTVYTHAVPVLAEFCRITGIQGVFPDLES